jgi:hypothetical protein
MADKGESDVPRFSLSTTGKRYHRTCTAEQHRLITGLVWEVAEEAFVGLERRD